MPLAAYSQQLRLELEPQGLHVLLVCPGPIARDEPRGAGSERAQENLEGIPENARKPGAGAKVTLLQPEYLAERIIQACERRQPELVLPGSAAAVCGVGDFAAVGRLAGAEDVGVSDPQRDERLARCV